ncbi:hypothetical protein ACN28S_48360 [Cystobacter fuscus]
MWHTFILETRDYMKFCERYFGFYIHHKPTPQEEHEAQQAEYELDPQAFLAAHEAMLRPQYELIYEQLGADTLLKWYSEYLERYTEAFMASARRWSFSPPGASLREQLRLPCLPAETSEHEPT